MNRYPIRTVSLFFFTIFFLCLHGCFYFPGSTLQHTTEVPHFVTIKGQLSGKKIIKGFGKVKISIDGAKYQGTFELTNPSPSGCTATFYSPFGGILGQIETEGDSGTVDINGKTFHVSVDQPLDTFGFLWGEQLSVRDFMSLLSGVIPHFFLDRPFAPEKYINKCFGKIVVYVCESDRIYLHFSLRLSKLKRIILDYSTNENPFFIINSCFSGNVPKHISVKRDKKNFLEIEYERIVTD